MRKLIVWMAACGCVVAGFGARAATGPDLTGDWRGALAKGALRSAAYLHFEEKDGNTRGSFWGGDLAASAIERLEIRDSSVHFEVPGIASFDGVVEGDQLSGSFHDSTGAGSFALEKQPAWDDPMNTP